MKNFLETSKVELPIATDVASHDSVLNDAGLNEIFKKHDIEKVEDKVYLMNLSKPEFYLGVDDGTFRRKLLKYCKALETIVGNKNFSLLIPDNLSHIFGRENEGEHEGDEAEEAGEAEIAEEAEKLLRFMIGKEVRENAKKVVGRLKRSIRKTDLDFEEFMKKSLLFERLKTIWGQVKKGLEESGVVDGVEDLDKSFGLVVQGDKVSV